MLMRAVLIIIPVIMFLGFVLDSIPKEKGSNISSVERIVDGDTFYIGENKVRLIGINTPEIGEKCFLETKNKLKELILNKEVRLEIDILQTDRYDRLLRYVYVANDFVNLEMVKGGFAVAEKIKPNVKYADDFEDAEKSARESKLGCLWS